MSEPKRVLEGAAQRAEPCHSSARYAGIIHDFVGLDPLRGTHAAIAQGIAFLTQVLHTGDATNA